MSEACRFGIEEEYFLSDAANRGIVRKVQPKFIAARQAFPEEVQREMLQSQIEVATPVCESMEEARRLAVRPAPGSPASRSNTTCCCWPAARIPARSGRASARPMPRATTS
jgi:hypothetical protein